jgi:hypothetical protein
MYYYGGTVSATANTKNLIGYNTGWASTFTFVGDAITIGNSTTVFEVVAVLSPTCLRLDQTISTTVSNIMHGLYRDFTPGKKMYEITDNDRDWGTQLTSSFNTIDTNISVGGTFNDIEISDGYLKNAQFGTGVTVDTQADTQFVFGTLARWSQVTVSVPKTFNMEACAADSLTATSVVCGMYIGNEPCGIGGTGKFLLTGFASNPYWKFNNVGRILYIGLDGMITETAPNSSVYWVQSVGLTLSKTSIFFDPDFYLA